LPDTVWIIRHGMTALNSEAGGEDRIRGNKDVPLSKAGHAEAEKLGKKLANSNIDVLFHSPLSRAADTAKAIARTTGAKLITMEELRPWKVGELTGERTAIAHPILAEYCCKTPDKAVPGKEGESFNSFMDRLFGGIRKICNSGYRHPAIVSHHRVERALAGYEAAGQPADHHIDEKVFLEKGEPTAHAEKMTFKNI